METHKDRHMYPPPHMTHVSSSSYDTYILLLICRQTHVSSSSYDTSSYGPFLNFWMRLPYYVGKYYVLLLHRKILCTWEIIIKDESSCLMRKRVQRWRRLKLKKKILKRQCPITFSIQSHCRELLLRMGCL